MHIGQANILALDPGTKEIGVAILKGQQLDYFGVKTFRQRQPPHLFLATVASYLTGLIAAHRPTVLAIEQTFSRQRESALLNVTAAEITYTARQHGLKVFTYDPAKVRQTICQVEKGTKRETAQIVARQYPELARYLKHPTRWEALYWGHVFDAVAVGLCYWQDINKEVIGNDDEEK